MRNMRIFIGLAVILTVSLIGVLLVSRPSLDLMSSELDTVDYRDLPDSAEQVVAQSDVIVIGSIVAFIGTSVEVRPIPTDILTNDFPDAPDASEFMEDVSDFAFLVDSILKSDLSFEVGDTITLRVGGANNANRPPDVGATYLLMGGAEDHYPEDVVSPLGGNQGLFLAHDTSANVRYSYGDPVPWAAGLTVQQLIDEIMLVVGD